MSASNVEQLPKQLLLLQNPTASKEEGGEPFCIGTARRACLQVAAVSEELGFY